MGVRAVRAGENAAVTQSSARQRVASGSSSPEGVGQLNDPPRRRVEDGADEEDAVAIPVPLGFYNLCLAEFELRNLWRFARERLDFVVPASVPSALDDEVVAASVRSDVISQDDVPVAGNPLDVGVMTFEPCASDHLADQADARSLLSVSR